MPTGWREKFGRGAGALLLSLLLAGFSGLAAQAAESAGTGPGAARAFVDRFSDDQLDGLVELYRHFHAHPELSLQETETARRVAEALDAAGYQVRTGVGGTGVVGVLENGPGPTLLIRGDMDALPVSEETGLDYASEVTALLPDGRTTGVMHACGHDIHTTNLIGTARLLAEARSLWSGNLVVVAQPAEEIGQGARAMMADGLFDSVPRPDFTLALHVDASLPAGSVGYTSGWSAANVDSVDVTFYGRGGHGAYPHTAIDPIVTAASFIGTVQTLVSRRVDPQAPAVVTVGSIQAGTKHNVIPDAAALQLTVRSYSDPVREQLLEGIAQIASDTCRMFQCPRPPSVVIKDEYTPAVYNDPAFAARAKGLFEQVFGPDQVRELAPTMGGEDFGRYARALEVPGLLFRVGAQDPERLAASLEPGALPLPQAHSSRFAPVAAPTLRTAMRAMSLLALDVLAPSNSDSEAP